ncbi:MAG: carboxypeptidase-like regulatory domain-containing protein [Spirosomataceae bacterium]
MAKIEQINLIISGTVTDENGGGLPGVSILIKGTQRGTVTDPNGKYKIDVPDESAVLVFSYVGYLSQEIVVGNKTQINTSLATDMKALQRR